MHESVITAIEGSSKSPRTKVYDEPASTSDISRAMVGTTLLCAAAISLGAAALFETLGFVGENFRPLPFVGALVFVQLGFFSFWPVMRRKGKEASTLLKGVLGDGAQSEISEVGSLAESFNLLRDNIKQGTPKDVTLWNQGDPRLDLALFTSNVPTFVLSRDQRFLDWNPAFDLVFGDCFGIKRGAHVSTWFGHLDNFRRLDKRKDQLYGEGILPLADRERATFISKSYGRMVFTKIMNPILERSSGKVIGWTIVLNINSVNKRQKFLKALYEAVARETRAVRHASSHDGIFRSYRPYQRQVMRHVRALGEARRIVHVGAGTGLLSRVLLNGGRKVTAIEGDVHLLRRLKMNGREFPHTLRLVRQNPDEMRGVPLDRFDAAVLDMMIHRIDFPLDCLKDVHRTLKPGGTLSLTAILPSGGISQLFHDIRSDLERQDLYENLEHQFDAVYVHEADCIRGRPYGFKTREDLRAMMLEAGFSIDEEQDGLLDGHGIHLVGRKV